MPRRVANVAPKKAAERRWERKWLEVFAQVGVVTEACRSAGISTPTAYRRRDESPAFAAAWEAAFEASTQALELAAIQRAHDRSDVLAIFLLKARRPDTYRENARIEHTGPGGGPIVTEITVQLHEAEDG